MSDVDKDKCSSCGEKPVYFDDMDTTCLECFIIDMEDELVEAHEHVTFIEELLYDARDAWDKKQ